MPQGDERDARRCCRYIVTIFIIYAILRLATLPPPDAIIFADAAFFFFFPPPAADKARMPLPDSADAAAC